MRDLNFQLKKACEKTREDGPATKKDRLNVLQLVANQLYDLGYHKMEMRSLKAKHVKALFKHWIDKKLSVKTIKNRLSYMRWWARLINKPQEVYGKNRKYFSEFGVEGLLDKDETYEGASKVLTQSLLETIDDDITKYSLLLQEAFGLHYEETMKLNINDADQETFILIQGIWAKNKRPRSIPIVTIEQRLLIRELKAVTQSGGCLLPPQTNYRQYRPIYKEQINKSNLKSDGVLRWLYMNRRYVELTGHDSPKEGGIDREQMSVLQRKTDRIARITIAKELGHKRINVVCRDLG